MKSEWNKNWNRSRQPRRQRKYVYNAPMHVRRKLVSAHLSSELRKKYRTRSLSVRKGDKVTILRGRFSGTSGKVEKVNLKKLTIFVENVKVEKNDGTMVMCPVKASNVMITTLNLDDKKRVALLKRKGKKSGQIKKTGSKSDKKPEPKKKLLGAKKSAPESQKKTDEREVKKKGDKQ